jgi:2-polyprenyl-6-methoxyphenol hydroxylase-like FAD-dependent oxidoreductase
MENNLVKNKSIAIIGGGPVGLVTARLLQMRGAHVKVYERDENKDARISGGTLDMHQDVGQIALREAGLLEAYFASSRAVGERNYDRYANLVREDVPSEETKFLRPEIDRRDLRKIVLDVLEVDTVLWNKNLVSVEKSPDQYHLSFGDGSKATADLVIGADGGRSKIRPLVTEVSRRYTGTTIIQGDIQQPELKCPQIFEMTNRGNLAALGEEKLIFIQCRRDGSLNYYVSFRRTETWFRDLGLDLTDLPAMHNFLTGEFQNWDQSFHQLFKAAGEFQLLPMYCLPVGTPWANFDNIALVGDAAHVMPPFAGVGVNIGLLDALHLANNLTRGNFSSISEAIKDYTETMYNYAAKAQADTAQAELDFHDADAANNFGDPDQ